MNYKLNNKGYMLIEIILASVIAMAVAYFMTDLTIKLKNKNDDLMVRTAVATDQAIIYNEIMKDLYNYTSHSDLGYAFDGISDIKDMDDRIRVFIDPTTNSKKFEYDRLDGTEFELILSDYTQIDVDDIELKEFDTGYYKIKIPILVKQFPDEDFDVEILFY